MPITYSAHASSVTGENFPTKWEIADAATDGLGISKLVTAGDRLGITADQSRSCLDNKWREKPVNDSRLVACPCPECKMPGRTETGRNSQTGTREKDKLV